jgi:hypothetical protein
VNLKEDDLDRLRREFDAQCAGRPDALQGR